MRKGEEKRQEILRAAETLFYQKGYDETSVQDILDVLHTSKGSFYHHFESKDSVLETLCTARAAEARGELDRALQQIHHPLERLDAVFRWFIPLRMDHAAFLRLMLPLLFRPEGRAVRVCFSSALEAAFLPILQDEIYAASLSGVVFPPPGERVSVIIAHLLNDGWMHVAASMLEKSSDGGAFTADDRLKALETYRRVLERILDAPYGCFELVKLEEWHALYRMLQQGMT